MLADPAALVWLSAAADTRLVSGPLPFWASASLLCPSPPSVFLLHSLLLGLELRALALSSG